MRSNRDVAAAGRWAPTAATSSPPGEAMYVTYVSPDGEHEQVAARPADEVRLRFAGWTKKQPKPVKEPTKKQPNDDNE